MVRPSRTVKESESIPPITLVKRKRKASPSPVPVVVPHTPSLKVILPSPSSLGNGHVKDTSPLKNGDGDHEPKRQKLSLSLKIKGANGSEKESGIGEVEQANVEDVVMEEDEPEEKEALDGPKEEGKDEVKEELEGAKTKVQRVLSRDIREALALVISQMALDLPLPLNKILSLWLPPDFTKSDTNTLGYVLRQDTLTWESLVDLLHTFSENLLQPCNYPNPMPPLARIDLPTSPLPSHFPPHKIYNFCASLHSLMLQIQPMRHSIMEGGVPERWGLMQKVVGNGQSGMVGGEWWTGCVDARAVDAGLRKLEGEEGGLLANLAGKGDKFGYATPVCIQSALGSQKPPKYTLSDVMIRKASLKQQRWKEIRQDRRLGGFGDIQKPVTVPIVAGTSFTPSFAPTYDSTTASGGVGYYDTLNAMHERRRRTEWRKRSMEGYVEARGYYGSIEVEGSSENKVDRKGKGKEAVVEDLLADNADLLEELSMWQDVRVKKGDEAWMSERESRVADHLLASLTELAGSIPPSEMLSQSIEPGLAHTLAKRFLPTSSPSIRGTLDPRRPHALHDNATIRVRPSSSTTGIASTSTPAARPSIPYLPQTSATPLPPTNRYSPYQPPQTSVQPPRYPAQPPASTYKPYTPQSTSTPNYSRPNPLTAVASPAPIPSPTPTNNTRPGPGPGPSTLRQSFGPGHNPGLFGHVPLGNKGR